MTPALPASSSRRPVALAVVGILVVSLLASFSAGLRPREAVLTGFLLTLLAATAIPVYEAAMDRPRRTEFLRYLLRILALSVRRCHSPGYALLSLAGDSGGRRGKAAFRMLAVLDEGRPLSAALEAAGKRWVPRQVIETVRAGEKSGRLAEALEAALEDCATPKVGSHGGRATLGIVYVPMMAGIFLFLTTYILPQFGSMFGQITDKHGIPLQLPAITKFVLGLGDAMSFLAGPWGFVLLLLALLIRSAFARERFRWLRDAVGLRLPVVGRCVLLRAGQRFCRSLAVEVRAGTPMAEALARAGEASGNLSVQRSATAAAESAAQGVPADRAVASVRLPVFVRARAAAAAGGGPERLASSLEALAAECRWKYVRTRDGALAAVYPCALMASALLVLCVYLGVFAVILRLQGALR